LALLSIAIGFYDLENRPVAGTVTALDWLDLIIVGVFIIDFVHEGLRHGSLYKYAQQHWWEIPSLIPLTGGMIAGLDGVFLVRGLRLIRFIRIARLLRILGVVMRYRAVTEYLLRVARSSQMLAIFSVGAVVVLLGSLFAYHEESHMNPRIKSLGDSVWWSLNMFTNVAYVDFPPATAGGRVVAAMLQVLGIAFIGIFAASVTKALLKVPTPGEAQLQSVARNSRLVPGEHAETAEAEAKRVADAKLAAEAEAKKVADAKIAAEAEAKKIAEAAEAGAKKAAEAEAAKGKAASEVPATKP